MVIDGFVKEVVNSFCDVNCRCLIVEYLSGDVYQWRIAQMLMTQTHETDHGE